MSNQQQANGSQQIQNFLSELAQLEIKVRLNENGNLAVQAPKGVMDAALAARIKENKSAIIAFLRAGDAGLKSLVVLQPHGDKRPFFCIHGGAGHILHYQDWAKALGKERPFYGLQPLMSETDGTRSAFLTVPEMAAHYVREIRTVQPRGPYLLGGFCFGGVLALEMAHQLETVGEKVSLLAFIDPTIPANLPPPKHQPGTPAPNAPQRWLARHRPELVQRHLAGKAAYLLRMAQNRFRFWWQTDAKESWVRFKAFFFQLYLQLGRPVPSRFHDFYFMNVVTTHAVRSYQPARFDGDIVLFTSIDAGGIPMSWKRVVRQDIISYALPTSHLGMLEQPFIAQIATKLKPHLEKVETAAATNSSSTTP